MRFRILYFGVYDPSYSRNRSIATALRANTDELIECRTRPGTFWWYRLLRAYLPLRHSYDVMVVGFPGQKVMFLARLLTRRPIVFDAFTSHYGGYVLDRKRAEQGSIRARWYRYLDKGSCLRADAVLLDTQAHIDFFIREYGLRPELFHRIWVGADTTMMHPENDGHHSDMFTVHFHGHYIPHHGALRIIEAAALLRGEPIRFRMIGQGQQRAGAERRATELKLKNVEFLPNMPYARLAEYVRSADLCLGVFGNNPKTFLTITNKIFEAAASAKPIITLDTPAVRELFTDGRDILLSRPDDPAHLAELILKVYRNPLLAERLGKNAFDTFGNKCSDKKIAELIGEVLTSLNTLYS